MSDLRMHDLLVQRGAIREGHFLLSSGRHSDVYVEKARVFEDPDLTVRLGREIASWYENVDVVVSPAVGALPLGFATALGAPARFIYAERERGRMTLRRGFSLSPGERALVVEDVITTGGSAAEVWELVGESDAERLGVAALVDRSGAELPFPLRAVVRIVARSFGTPDCPLCADGLPVESPGSRQLA
ncbi:MAG TPA: orotate phosphoribosyltransferase [Actinomycetota bacterium]|nr:orotate phosphoribosyltransferase [Actinomycetota bacterium]